MSSSFSMVAAVVNQSYDQLLQQVADCSLDQGLRDLVDNMAAQRLQQASSLPDTRTSSYQAMAEALGLWRLQRCSEAYALLVPLEADLAKDPRYWILCGMVARRLPQAESIALRAYRRALALDASRADLHYNLANLLKDVDPPGTEQAYLRSLRLNPAQPACWHNLGALLHRQDRFTEARHCITTSLRLDPAAANVWCDLGNVLQAQDLLEAAKRAFAHAIALDRSHAASHINLGAALVQGLQPDQALAYLQRGVELDRSSADSLWNLALAHLQLGDFDSGWSLYDARLHLSKARPGERPTAGPMPASLAECPRSGQPPLVVWCEQGMGDAIQFIRYLALLDAAGVAFEFRCRQPLLTLFQTWTGLQHRAVAETGQLDQADLRPQIPLLSLPRLFGTSLVTIPAALPYLRPPAEPPAELRVPQPPGGLAVGLVWASHAGNPTMYRRKSIPLDLLMPRLLDLVDLDLIDLHALQCGPDEAQLEP